MNTQQADPRYNTPSHQRNMLNVTAKTWDELRSRLQAIKPGSASQQAQLDLANSLLAVQTTFPGFGLDLALFPSILQLNSIECTQGSAEYQTLTVLKSKLDGLISQRPRDIGRIFQCLANLCRIEEWRIPFGEAGYLQIVIDALLLETSSGKDEEADRLNMQAQALRLMGNMCADIDENRDRVLQYHGLQVIISKFRNEQLAHIAIPVLFNICNDHDAAKQAAIQSNLFEHCLEVLETDISRGTEMYSALCLLLDIICDKVDATTAPSNALDILLKASLVGWLEIGQRLSFGNLVNKLLALENNQKRIILEEKFDLVLGALFRLFSEDQDPMIVVLSGYGQTTGADADEAQDLLEVRQTLIMLLSDMSSLSEFATKNKIFTDTSMIVWKLRYIMPSPLALISQAACLMLGNLACSDEICIKMVREVAIHEAASAILKEASDTILLHSALGLLRNLAVPSENKESLAMVGVIENLQKWLSADIHPQVQLAAASLLRQLINSSINNIQRLLLVPSSAANEPASIQTRLAGVLRVYAKTDEVAIKTELARTVIAILRCVYGNDVDSTRRTSMLAELYSNHEHLAQPIIDMTIQSQYPVVRSEAWFGLGIMSREAAGRASIARDSTLKFLEVLRSTTRGDPTQDIHKQDELIERAALPPNSNGQIAVEKDRENALVMIHELSKMQDLSDVNGSLHESLKRLLSGRFEESS